MKIIGTGSALPKLAVTNHMLTRYFDTSDEWIRTRTGICERRVLSDDTLEELAVQAAKNAVEDAGIDAGDIDMILCSTVLSTYVTPALGCLIQGGIGARCPAYDINSACAGFVYALDIADAYIASGRYKNILIVCAENTTRMVDWGQRETSVLFGDGAGAAVITQGNALKAIGLTCDCDKDILYSTTHPGNSPFVKEPEAAQYLKMKGQDVFKFAVEQSIAGINAMLKEAGETLEAIDHFVLHQANMRILKLICEKLRRPIERFAHNVDRLGNTSSASVPILLDEMRRGGKLKAGEKIAISAFGAGLVTGTCILEWCI